MKTAFKTGGLSINVTISEAEIVTRRLVAVDGEKLAVPEVIETKTVPEKKFTLDMEPMEFTLEAEVGELADIYAEIAPMLTEIMWVVKEVVKANAITKA